MAQFGTRKCQKCGVAFILSHSGAELCAHCVCQINDHIDRNGFCIRCGARTSVKPSRHSTSSKKKKE